MNPYDFEELVDHGISVNEMVLQEGGSTHFKISCTKLKIHSATDD